MSRQSASLRLGFLDGSRTTLVSGSGSPGSCSWSSPFAHFTKALRAFRHVPHRRTYILPCILDGGLNISRFRRTPVVCPNLCSILEALLIGELACFARMFPNTSGLESLSECSETVSDSFVTGYGMGIEIFTGKPFRGNECVDPFQFGQETTIRQFLCGLRPHLLRNGLTVVQRSKCGAL